MRKNLRGFLAAGAIGVCAWGALASVTVNTVVIGNPGNPGELSGEGAGGLGYDRVCGAVDYVYRMSQFQVTAGDYTAFLNAVAATDTYELYHPSMWTNEYGCMIEQAGVSGAYAYAVASDWANRPVNFISWGDAARYCNWLHNGQPTGGQNAGTTEDGSYFINGGMSNAELIAVVREPDATWVLPTEDEWYKAAYHRNDGVTGNYYDYAMGSDDLPSNELLDPDPGNSGNFYQSDYTIGSPYWRTEVGEFENSASPYGTFDQNSNVFEWTESEQYGVNRMLRGGAFNHGSYNMEAAYRNKAYTPTYYSGYAGMRIALVPEPGMLAGLLIGVLALVRRGHYSAGGS